MSVQNLIERVVKGEDPRKVLSRALQETTFPKSFWDRYPEAERPFYWSSPMGGYTSPWRVTDKDKLEALVKKLFGREFPDVYADHYNDVGGKRALWLGLRGTPAFSKGVPREERMTNLARNVKAAQWPYKMGQGGYLYVLDDLPTHPHLGEQQSEEDETPDEKAGGALGSYYLQLKREGWKAVKAPRSNLKMSDCEALGKLNGEKVKRLLDQGIVLAKDTKDGLAK